MTGTLRKTYFLLLIPAIILFILISACKLSPFTPEGLLYPPLFAAVIFMLSVLFALAAPVFYRSVFAYRLRIRTSTTPSELIRFERNLIRIALITPYLGLVAYGFEFPDLYFGGSVLMSLYAVYYFYPSNRRLAFERRIFRVR